MEKVCYKEEVKPYRKTNYKLIIKYNNYRRHCVVRQHGVHTYAVELPLLENTLPRFEKRALAQNSGYNHI